MKYQCSICHMWFYRSGIHCLVLHQPGTCCHEFERRVPSIEIAIRNVVSGQTAIITGQRAWVGEPPQTEEERDGVVFWWTDGNGGCDCNRFIAFEHALGREVDVDKVTCGGAEQTFKIRLAINGDVLVDEIGS